MRDMGPILAKIQALEATISDQAKEIERLTQLDKIIDRDVFNSEMNLETTVSSLNLAIKALEEIQALTWNGVDPLPDINEIIKSTLSEIKTLGGNQ